MLKSLGGNMWEHICTTTRQGNVVPNSNLEWILGLMVDRGHNGASTYI